MKKDSTTDKEVLETSDSYKIGKTVVTVNRVFRDSDAETLDKIIINLIKKDAEKP